MNWFQIINLDALPSNRTIAVWQGALYSAGHQQKTEAADYRCGEQARLGVCR